MGSKKEKFLTILVLLFLAILILETMVILGSFSGGGIPCSLFKKTGEHQATSQQETAKLPEWNPFQEMTIFRERMNRMMDDIVNRGSAHPVFHPLSQQFALYEPEVDIEETEKELTVRCDLPGLEKDKIHVEVKNNYVTIQGIRNFSVEENGPQGNLYRKERRFGSFTKTFLLPVAVDETQAKASYQNGVLTLQFPKLNPGAGEDKKTSVAIS